MGQALCVATIATVAFFAGVLVTLLFIKMHADKSMYSSGYDAGFDDGYEWGKSK